MTAVRIHCEPTIYLCAVVLRGLGCFIIRLRYRVLNLQWISCDSSIDGHSRVITELLCIILSD